MRNNTTTITTNNTNDEAIEMNETNETIEAIETSETKFEITGYKFAKMLNILLADANLSQVKPQMIYNYMTKGYIKAEPNGLISSDELVRFANHYISRKIARQASAEVKDEALLQLLQK